MYMDQNDKQNINRNIYHSFCSHGGQKISYTGGNICYVEFTDKNTVKANNILKAEEDF